MAKRTKNGKSLRNPVVLSARAAEGSNVIQVIIETPKGSRNKYAFDPDQRIFELKKALPAGMAFPYDSDLYRRPLPRMGTRSGAHG